LLLGVPGVAIAAHGLWLLTRVVDDERARADMLEWRIFREHMERTR
jgi:hypothetical protein